MRVLVLDGNENQAVACVRSLSRAGHRVEVGSSSGWSKAGWSRHSSTTFRYPSPSDNARAFVDAVMTRAAAVPGTLVMPLTERSTLPLSAMRDRAAAASARLVLPDHATVLRAFDKAETTRIAREAGVETPRTTLLESPADLEPLLHSARYPLVVKPAASATLGDSAGVRSTGGPHYASTPNELRAAFDAVHARTSRMIAQEFVPGRGAGYFALMVHGEPRAEFAHRRIRDVRPSGSGSSVRESVAPDPMVREAALRVLRELGWHGVAMVEFRLRPDGVPVFLEVNGRFWNSLALAVNAGVDFPAMVARLAEYGDVPASDGYRIGTRCRWLLGDARHLVAVIKGRPRGFTGDFPERLRTVRDFLTPVRGTFHDNFTLDDPLPELGDWLDFFVHKIPASLSSRGQP